jgi:hypothetical protein
MFTARAVLATCGDGVLQVGEACDATAPGGDAACPGACIPSGLVGQCSCAAASTDARRFVLVADSQLRLGTKTLVISGNVAVVRPLGMLTVGPDVLMPGASQAIGDLARVFGTARIGRLFANDATIMPGAEVMKGGPFRFAAPLAVLDGLPPYPLATPSGSLIDVLPGETRILTPGVYGSVLVEPNGKLILRGLSPGSGAGTYQMQMLRVGARARVQAYNPVVIDVSEKFLVGYLGQFTAAPVAGLIAGDLQLNVNGSGVGIGRSSTVAAHIRAPHAKARLGKGSFFSGRVIAQRIVSTGAFMTLEGACGDGLLQPNERCDTSAPGGDAACPGACVPGDPEEKGQIAAGQPGQCSCRCTDDAQCDDQNACNGRETCQDSICVPGVPLDCNDHNVCTRDCDPAVGCVNAPVEDGTPCSDGTKCTDPDTCQQGSCVPGPPVVDGTSCSDGNKCTVLDTCQGGACVGGPTRDCSDDNPCTADSCDPDLGCRHTTLPDGTACASGKTCRAGVCS